MTTTHEFWTPIYNAFDPWGLLWGEQLEQYFVEREGRLVDRLASQLSPDRLPIKVLLSGQMGTGKTSELMSLIRGVSDELFVVWFDAFYSLDLESTSYLELLFALGMAVYRAAEVDLGLKLDTGLRDELAASLATIVRKHTGNDGFEVDVGQWVSNIVSFGLGISGVKVPPLNLQGLSLGVSEEVVARREIKPEIPKVSDSLNRIISEVEAECKKPLLLIVDGLDKMSRAKAQVVFAEGPVLVKPDCRVIYLAPITFSTSAHYPQVKGLFYPCVLYNVMVHERGNPDAPHEPGIRVMREMVTRRLHSLEVEEADVIEPEVLDELAMMSGGIMREMVQLVREAATQAQLEGERRITREAASRAVLSLRRQYANGLRKPHYEEMQSLLESGQPSDTDVFEELLQALYVLIYSRDGSWYEVHPNVRPVIEGEG